jgi:hypothetical protein
MNSLCVGRFRVRFLSSPGSGEPGRIARQETSLWNRVGCLPRQPAPVSRQEYRDAKESRLIVGV